MRGFDAGLTRVSRAGICAQTDAGRDLLFWWAVTWNRALGFLTNVSVWVLLGSGREMDNLIPLIAEDFASGNDLPELAQHIAFLIGAEKAALIVNQFAGVTIYLLQEGVRRGPRKEQTFLYREFVDLVGQEDAYELAKAFKSERISIPHCRKFRILKRNESVQMLFDQMTVRMTALEAVFRLSRRFGISDRHVWRILKMPL